MILLPAGEGGVSTQCSTNGLSRVSFIAVRASPSDAFGEP